MINFSDKQQTFDSASRRGRLRALSGHWPARAASARAPEDRPPEDHTIAATHTCRRRRLGPAERTCCWLRRVEPALEQRASRSAASNRSFRPSISRFIFISPPPARPPRQATLTRPPRQVPLGAGGAIKIGQMSPALFGAAQALGRANPSSCWQCARTLGPRSWPVDSWKSSAPDDKSAAHLMRQYDAAAAIGRRREPRAGRAGLAGEMRPDDY